MYSVTTATTKIGAMKKRIRIVQGGTSASKTISILLLLINLAQSDTEPTLTSIVSESFPHLKRGVMRDFLNILETHRYYKDRNWNKTDYVYTFETGSRIEFFSVDQPSKVRGPRRDRLFMNECNNTPYESFDQLEVRTKDFIFLDYNPTTEFWVQEEIINKRNDYDFAIVTYKDNEALDPMIVASIEQRKENKAWWTVYGLGLIGEIESRIYKGWNIIDEIPHEARLVRYGLDFGYTNDPTAIVAIYEYNGGYILDEVCHRTQMLNSHISGMLANLPSALVVADAAEPKSIEEIKRTGINIIAAVKGQGSVLQGIQYVQDQKVSMTKQSVNLIKSYRNYTWITDKEGKIINEPDHEFSDILDATRYGLTSLQRNIPTVAQQFFPSHKR